MATESKSTPRVLNRGTDAVGETKVLRDVEVDSETFSTTLSNGRQIVLREMMAGDLLYLEKSLGNLGDTERSLKLIVRLSTSEGRVTYADLHNLKTKDLKTVTNLLTEASGVDEDDEDDFPNE
jgi:hypothetical protein